MVKRWTPVASLVALCACGGASAETSTVSPPARLPTLEGRPVYHRPIKEARPAVRQMWERARRASQDRLDPPDEGLDMSEYEGWLREVARPWTAARAVVLKQVAQDLERFSPSGSAEALFALVVSAVLYDDFISQVMSLPLPRDVEGSPALAEAMRSALAGSMRNAAVVGAEVWRSCVQIVPAAPPPLRVWGEECARRAKALESLIARTPEPSRSSPTGSEGRAQAPALPPECDGETAFEDPEAPPPDLTSPPVVALRYVGPAMDDGKRERLLAAARRRVADLIDLPLLPRSEVRRAEALHAEHRMTPGAPACGQPPPVAAIIARGHPNLVLADLETDCLFLGSGGECEVEECDCILSVSYRRAGTDDREGLPEALQVHVPRPRRGASPEPDAWIAAAARLEPGGAGSAGIFGMFTPGTSYRIVDHQDEDPRLRVAPTLRTDARRALVDCLPAAAVTRLELAWTISPVGETSEVEVQPSTVRGVDAEQLTGCIAAELSRLKWPCTPSGQPERANVRLCMSRAAEP